MCYSSRIDNEKEKAQIHCDVKIHDFVTINSLLYPYEYAAISVGKWKGLGGVTPDTHEAHSAKIENVIAAVTAINKKILNPDKRKEFRNVFRFGVDDNNRVTYSNFRNGFKLALSGPLFEVLHLKKRKRLSKEDYKLTYLDTNSLQQIAHVVIKGSQEK